MNRQGSPVVAEPPKGPFEINHFPVLFATICFIKTMKLCGPIIYKCLLCNVTYPPQITNETKPNTRKQYNKKKSLNTF